MKRASGAAPRITHVQDGQESEKGIALEAGGDQEGMEPSQESDRRRDWWAGGDPRKMRAGN